MIVAGQVATDFAGARHSGAALKAAGVSLVLRYLPGGGGAWKHVSRAEIDDFHANGISVLLNFEATTAGPLRGRAQGLVDGPKAVTGAKLLGYPERFPIIYSVDTDVTASAMGRVIDYFTALHETPGHTWPIGVYGEADVLDALAAAGLSSFGWQTVAWSHRRVSAHASLLQQVAKTAGLEDTDNNLVLKSFDAWGPSSTKPLPPPTPAEVDMIALDVNPNAPNWCRLVINGTEITHATGPMAAVLGRANVPAVTITRDELVSMLSRVRVARPIPCPVELAGDAELVAAWTAAGGCGGPR